MALYKLYVGMFKCVKLTFTTKINIILDAKSKELACTITFSILNFTQSQLTVITWEKTLLTCMLYM